MPDRNDTGVLQSIELSRMDAYWRAANFLSVGQMYLDDNPLLREPLTLAHGKPLVVGHWGTTSGQNFIYVHLNRAIKAHDLNMIYVAGPGHGGPALVANTYLQGSYSEIYPNISQDEPGLKKLFTQFSFPGGICTNVVPTTPGSIHDGGELGFSLSHAFGGCGWTPWFVEGHEPGPMHQRMAAAVEQAVTEIKRLRHAARTGGNTIRPRWPMIVLDRHGEDLPEIRNWKWRGTA